MQKTIIQASGRARLAAVCALLVFLALTTGYLMTRSPWWDEGLFADVALNFRNFRHLGSSALDPNGYLQWPEVHRFTYWQLPMYLVALGTWFHLVPATVQWMRGLSLLFACVYLVSWFVMVRALSRSEPLALFVTCVVALDYSLISAASDGRMEMMCAGLGYAGIASYLYFRETRWSLGIGLAGLFGAGSLFCHPMGAVTNASIAALVLLDWRRIEWRRVWIGLLPCGVGALLCGLYIWQAPQIFEAQYHAATAYRERTLFTLLKSVATDAYTRFWENFFALQSGVNRARVIILIFAVAGTVALSADRKLRSEPLGKRLLILAAIAYMGVAIIDNQGFPFYMVYTLPVMTGCGAVWVAAQWQRGKGMRRFMPAALLAASLCVVVAGYSLKLRKDGYQREYEPAVEAAEHNSKAGGVIMGGSELGFLLGFRSNLVDDRYLGYFSGVTPDVYVQSQYYYRMPGTELTRAWNASRQKLQREYRLVFQNAEYRVYALKSDLRTDSR